MPHFDLNWLEKASHIIVGRRKIKRTFSHIFLFIAHFYRSFIGIWETTCASLAIYIFIFVRFDNEQYSASRKQKSPKASTRNLQNVNVNINQKGLWVRRCVCSADRRHLETIKWHDFEIKTQLKYDNRQNFCRCCFGILFIFTETMPRLLATSGFYQKRCRAMWYMLCIS